MADFCDKTVLCRVCSDIASGFHYGVHACEGCKGFFRRSIQQKIQYRPCTQNQQCNIHRISRNRCQFCRLKKCLSVGMSRDAVRLGRVPKKEKVRIIGQMQKKHWTSQSGDLDMVHAVVSAHRQTCDISQVHVQQLLKLAVQNQNNANCFADLACPLNNRHSNQNGLNEFSEKFIPAVRSVVDFAKAIPGFSLLHPDDQVTLLKAGAFEVLLVRMARLFDSKSNTLMFTSGKLYKRQSGTVLTKAGVLLDCMSAFAEQFNKMCLKDDEIALFSAVVLMASDIPGLRNAQQVRRIQNKLTELLENIICTNHKEDETLFPKLLMKMTDLRTLNTLHSDKSIAAKKSHCESKDIFYNDVDFEDSFSIRFNDQLGARNIARSDSITSSLPDSATSSPIEEGRESPCAGISSYHVASNGYIMPAILPNCMMGCSSDQAVKICLPNKHHNSVTRNSTCVSHAPFISRSYSDSLSQKDHVSIRPRCYSFQMGDHGISAQTSHNQLQASQHRSSQHVQIVPSSTLYNSPELSRGSLGTAFDLYNQRPSMLKNCRLSYVKDEDNWVTGVSRNDAKYFQPTLLDGYITDMHLTSHAVVQYPDQLAPLHGEQWLQENTTRYIDCRSCTWNTSKRDSFQNDLSRDVSSNPLVQVLNCDTKFKRKNCFEFQTPNKSPRFITNLRSNANESEKKTFTEYLHSSQSASSVNINENKLHLDKCSMANPLINPINIKLTSSPKPCGGSLKSSLFEDCSTEVFGHKKFDRFRKDKAQVESASLTIHNDFAERMKGMNNAETKIDSEKAASDKKSRSTISKNVSSCASNDRLQISAKAAHPNLLAHLMNANKGAWLQHPSSELTTTAAVSASLPRNHAWPLSGQLSALTNQHLQS